MYNTTPRVPSAGSTLAARTNRAVQCGNRIVARTLPGAGVTALAAKSTRPHGQGAFGKQLPIAKAGRMVSRAPSQASRPATLGLSSTTSRTIPGPRRSNLIELLA
jgi:hypothetical protein